ncbi:MAG TPA: hypothetical protein VKA46_22060 [Gemmataceae bacterium]|nr:hypothetical protein [Gemmataceae bacterium]
MEVAYAVLANAVEQSSDGKCYVLGFDVGRVVGNRYPLTIGSISLLTKLIFAPEECGRQHHLSVSFSALGGERLEPQIEQDFQAPPLENPEHQEHLRIGITIAMQDLTIPAPGTYTFRLLVDGTEATTIRLAAEEIPGQPAEGQPE